MPILSSSCVLKEAPRADSGWMFISPKLTILYVLERKPYFRTGEQSQSCEVQDPDYLVFIK